LTARPELKQQASLVLASRDAKNGSLYGPLIPTVDAAAFWGGLGGGRRGVGDTFGGQQDYVVGLSWRLGPGGLFDFGRVRSSDSRLKIAELTANKAEDEAVRQMIAAFTRWQSWGDQLETTRHALAAAEEGLQLAQRRKEFAVGVVLETIQTEQDLTQARLDYLRAVAEFNKSQFLLNWSIGSL
jgi:outer membrane protein TolC